MFLETWNYNVIISRYLETIVLLPCVLNMKTIQRYFLLYKTKAYISVLQVYLEPW